MDQLQGGGQQALDRQQRSIQDNMVQQQQLNNQQNLQQQPNIPVQQPQQPLVNLQQPIADLQQQIVDLQQEKLVNQQQQVLQQQQVPIIPQQQQQILDPNIAPMMAGVDSNAANRQLQIADMTQSPPVDSKLKVPHDREPQLDNVVDIDGNRNSAAGNKESNDEAAVEAHIADDTAIGKHEEEKENAVENEVAYESKGTTLHCLWAGKPHYVLNIMAQSGLTLVRD